ncbi:copper amine oxidase [Paenibacillus sp. PK3_47]|uniref:copper amine oxidase N-terminal domain-containing protein n=1 Tax=Paenibacillus sp. PK3_47 TaxID=2072642 RepID=UPI00201DA47D|nr:copper amine oxidase N-terminal domain-containing protein [Paenibacillus sp. PK3_47]UQZ34840.1 copper amine oxidase [Paenibacillus sp. PK3_47]
MKKYLVCLMLPVFALTIMANTAMARSSNDISIMVNKEIVNTDVSPYSERGTTIVPLNVVQQIPGIKVAWNNSNKTITIERNEETIKLVAGQKSATIGEKKVNLPVVSQIKNGRVMVPLRFIAEAADAYVGWNPYDRSIYVVKSSPEMIEKTKSENLTEARQAAFELPIVRTLKSMTQGDGSSTLFYYFPEGRADQVFMSMGNGVEYLEVIDGRLEQKWVARFGDKGSKGPFFLEKLIEEEDGTQPQVSTNRVIYFKQILKIGAAEYGIIDINGKVTNLGHHEMPGLYDFFDIPEEEVQNNRNITPF